MIIDFSWLKLVYFQESGYTTRIHQANRKSCIIGAKPCVDGSCCGCQTKKDYHQLTII